MKILTWNLERVKRGYDKILPILNQLDADILVLTETSSVINPGDKYNCIATKELPLYHDGIKYKAGENRVTIWSKYPIVGFTETYDDYTSVCANIETELGNLKVYGTIIGVFGGKGERFKSDLAENMGDLKKFEVTESVCIAGDLNTFLSGYAYPSHNARHTLLSTFDALKLDCLTTNLDENVDYIALSKHFTANKNIRVATWNHDKKLSDHIGICLTII